MGVMMEKSAVEEGILSLTVDVIIPVYKPDHRFKYLLERIIKQSVKPNRIYLLQTIEDDPEKQTEELRKSEEDIKSLVQELNDSSCLIQCVPIDKSDFDHGGTRNYGAHLSDADIILFMTQDAVPEDKDLIRNLLESFRNPQVAAAYGRQLPRKNAGTIEKYTRTFNYPEEGTIKSKEDLPRLGIKTYFCSNVCSAYRKEVYEELGGFVTKTIFNEDMIMAAAIIQAGYFIAYAAEAKVVHSHEYTYIQQFKRNFDLAVSQQQYKEVFSSVKSESEGIKLVKQTAQYLADEKKYILIPDLIFQSGFKYLGYLAGKNYERIPKSIIKKLSMNPHYW